MRSTTPRSRGDAADRARRPPDGAGGVGYLLKDRVTDLDDFADAIRQIAKGRSVIDPAVVAVLVGRRVRVPLDNLTERERAVLALMAEGRSNQAIGDRLSMARKTVEAHIANIFSKRAPAVQKKSEGSRSAYHTSGTRGLARTTCVR